MQMAHQQGSMPFYQTRQRRWVQMLCIMLPTQAGFQITQEIFLVQRNPVSHRASLTEQFSRTHLLSPSPSVKTIFQMNQMVSYDRFIITYSFFIFQTFVENKRFSSKNNIFPKEKAQPSLRSQLKDSSAFHHAQNDTNYNRNPTSRNQIIDILDRNIPKIIIKSLFSITGLHLAFFFF